MAKRFVILLFFFSFVQCHAQEPSVYDQNFKGVKSIKFYSHETDSSGKELSKKILLSEYFYDSVGHETRRLIFEKGIQTSSHDFFYDSLGRKTMHIAWTKKGGNKKYIYRYETKGEFTIVREYEKNVVVSTQSNYWDETSKLQINRTWNGESTMGVPDDQLEYDKQGHLVKMNSYKGFTEYRYDSLGTLSYMVMRQFENGHCSAYIPFEYSATYANGRLSSFRSESTTTFFEYNDKGHIVIQKAVPLSKYRISVVSAEYQYY